MLEAVSLKITTTYTIELYWHEYCFIECDFYNPGYSANCSVFGQYQKSKEGFLLLELTTADYDICKSSVLMMVSILVSDQRF